MFQSLSLNMIILILFAQSTCAWFPNLDPTNKESICQNTLSYSATKMESPTVMPTVEVQPDNMQYLPGKPLKGEKIKCVICSRKTSKR